MPPPRWRREPYRLFFPLGLLLSWVGVAHWLLHAWGWLADYRPVFHSIAQIQGFMMCFALGFLLTAIPRRTGTPPAGAWQILGAAIAVVATVVCAWLQWFGASQLLWLVVVAILFGFAVARFRAGGAGRRPPNSFVWIPLSLLMGVVGSALIAAYGLLGEEYFGLHQLGRALLLQGMFCGLVVGAGGMVLPLLLRGQGPPDGLTSPRDRWSRGAHALGVLLLAGSFWWEQSASLRGGLGLRALLLAFFLLGVAGAWRPPSWPGWHRWLVWISAWMLPAGYALAAAFPEPQKAGLHVVVVGGLALMALSVGLHVSLAHGDRPEMARGRAWQVPVYGALLLLAMTLRTLMDFDAPRFFTWMAWSAGCFLLATVFWATLALPRMRGASAEPP